MLGLRTPEDAERYSQDLSSHAARFSRSDRGVLLADHRAVRVYSQEVADTLVELFVRMNLRLERVAIVVAKSNATLVMQLDRLVREAAFAARRVCYTPEEAAEHLSPILSPEELSRAREFLAELPSPPSQRTPSL